MPLVSCDYLFITQKGAFTGKEVTEEERAGALKVLVAHCGATKSMFAHAVPQKGVDPDGYIVEQLMLDILWLGHARVVIRSDNEPALLQVVDKTMTALKMKGVDVSNEGSVPCDPQSNGAAESAVGRLKGSVRTILTGLEQTASQSPIRSPSAGLVGVTCSVRKNVQSPWDDGKTPQQRARGTTYPDKLVEFGEACRYKCRAKEHGIAGHPWRFSVGVWLGVDKRTGQHIVYDRDMGGIRYARTVMALPEPQRWSLDKVQQVAVTPWSLHTATESEVIIHKGEDPAPARGGEEPAKLAQVRRLYIRQSDLDLHGYTQNCPRCQHILIHGPKEANVKHSEQCRTRLMEAIAKTPEGQLRIQKAMDKADRYIAEHLRRSDTANDAPAPGGDDGGLSNGAGTSSSSSGAPSSSLPSAFVPLTPAEFLPLTADNARGSSGPLLGSSGWNGASNARGSSSGMDVDIVEQQEELMDLRAVLAVIAKSHRNEVREWHREVVNTVNAMGQTGRKFRREATKRTRAIVSEIYSASRVTDAARRHARFGIIPGLEMDLTGVDEDDGKPWDFNDPTQRSKAEQLLDQQKPLLRVGSPMCTAFSNIQNLNKARRDPETAGEGYREGARAPQVVLSPLSEAGGQGQLFLHEHPAGATSRQERC